MRLHANLSWARMRVFARLKCDVSELDDAEDELLDGGWIMPCPEDGHTDCVLLDRGANS